MKRTFVDHSCYFCLVFVMLSIPDLCPLSYFETANIELTKRKILLAYRLA